MSDSAIRVENLVKYFDGRCVLSGISFNVPAGCIYGLLGRNGQSYRAGTGPATFTVLAARNLVLADR